MQTRVGYARVAIGTLIGAVVVFLMLAMACTQDAEPATAIPAATQAAEPTATTAPTSTPAPTATSVPPTAVPATNTPAPTATPRPTSTPAPTATPQPTSTPAPARQSVADTPAPDPTAVPTATAQPAEPAATQAPEAAAECPTPEQEAYDAKVDGYYQSFLTVMGDVAADWFKLQDDINLLFGDEFKASGQASVQKLRDLAAEMRAGDAPESMAEIKGLVLQVADKAEGYAASLEPLYDLAPGTPGVDLLLDLALQASAGEIQQLTAIGLNLTSAQAALCG